VDHYPSQLGYSAHSVELNRDYIFLNDEGNFRYCASEDRFETIMMSGTLHSGMGKYNSVYQDVDDFREFSGVYMSRRIDGQIQIGKFAFDEDLGFVQEGLWQSLGHDYTFIVIRVDFYGRLVLTGLRDGIVFVSHSEEQGIIRYPETETLLDFESGVTWSDEVQLTPNAIHVNSISPCPTYENLESSMRDFLIAYLVDGSGWKYKIWNNETDYIGPEISLEKFGNNVDMCIHQGLFGVLNLVSTNSTGQATHVVLNPVSGAWVEKQIDKGGRINIISMVQGISNGDMIVGYVRANGSGAQFLSALYRKKYDFATMSWSEDEEFIGDVIPVDINSNLSSNIGSYNRAVIYYVTPRTLPPIEPLYIVDVYLEDFVDEDPEDPRDLEKAGTPIEVDPSIVILMLPIEDPIIGDPGGGKRVARIDDKLQHGGSSGEITQGQINLTTNSRYTARLTDTVICRRRHHGRKNISESSETVTGAGRLGIARKGDHCTCGAVIVQGSPDTVAGD